MSKLTRVVIWASLAANAAYLASRLDDGPNLHNLLTAGICVAALLVLHLAPRK